MVHAVALRNLPGALAAEEPLQGFLPLVSIELGLAAEDGAASLGGRPAVVRPLHDPLALILGQRGQERDEAAPDGRGEVEVRLVEHLQAVSRACGCAR